MIFDVNDFSPNAVYHLMTQTVIPRPIAWVLTKNAEGSSHNLAPYSYFNAVSSDPPLLMISCAPKPDGSLKDTVTNTLREESLVIHIANDGQMQAVQDTAAPLSYGESEIDFIDAHLVDFGETGLKRLADAPIAFACSLYQHQVLGNAPQTLIFAAVESVYVAAHAVQQNDKRISVDAERISPLARLGKNEFSQLGKIILPQVK